MPNFSGIWSITQQMQAKGASTWPALPGAPTIGTATAGSSLCASVAFTAPACAGYPASVTGYRVISTPGCLTATGASSPLTVTGLTNATSYTFKVQATNATGYGALSSASNSITATNASSQSYTSSGLYTWVAPSGVTSVSVVAIGRGNAGSGKGGAGGGLGYKNNISVTPGNSYSVGVGYSSCGSFFCSISLVRGRNATVCGGNGIGGTYVGDGGGNGGNTLGYGGGGAGGYSGNGGDGSPNVYQASGSAGSGGGGGGGGARGGNGESGGGGGGTGLFGQGSSGTGGTGGCGVNNIGGGGGGGSSGGSGSGAYLSGCCYYVAYGGNGGTYGGGGGRSQYGTPGSGNSGAVRIVWPGNTRSFPSTCVGAP